MNIFKTYVKRNLKANRLRTTMTIAGIILSVALVAAVIEGAFSGIEYVRNILKDAYGNHHGYAINMTMDTAYELIQKDEIEGYSLFNTVGWAMIGSQNSTKPYLLVKEATSDIQDFLSVKISEGRFPENENEILLPAHLASNGNVHYKIGDTIELTLSERYLDLTGPANANQEKSTENSDSDNGYSYNGSDLIGNDISKLTDAEKERIWNGIMPENKEHVDGERLLSEEDGFTPLTRTYVVCGIMDRLPYSIEEYMCPGYTAIVKSTGLSPKKFAGEEIPECNVFFRVKDPSNYNIFHDTFEREHPGVQISKNRELVAMYGGISSRSITFFMTAFICVLIALILFGSISLVYNSFSISINERTKQIGILKSVGATKKQIRKTVFYEAFFDCIVSIPLGILLGCLGIGVTLFLIQDWFSAFLGYFGGFNSNGVKIQLVISIPLIIVGVIIVIVSVLMSAAIPALRAAAVSPIDLVRQNTDIKVSGKIKKSRILSRIFGAEGMLASKNYSCNKKRYRATIVSLAVSIILFIGASSFCSYLNSATESELYTGNVDLIYYSYGSNPYLLADPVEDLGEDAEYSLESGDVDVQAVNDDSAEKSNDAFGGFNTSPIGRDYLEIKEMLLSAQDVESVVIVNDIYDIEIIEPEDLETDNSYEEYSVTGGLDGEIDAGFINDPADRIYENNGTVFFIDDESYNELLKSEGIKIPEQSDGVMNAIVFNEGTQYTYDMDLNRTEYRYSFVEEDELPKKLKLRWYNEYGIPGLDPVDQVVDGEGNIYTVFLDDSKVIDFYNIMNTNVRWNMVEEAIYAEFRKYLESIGLPSEGVAWNNGNTIYQDLDNAEITEDSLESTSLGADIAEQNSAPLTEEELALISQCRFERRIDLCYTYDLNIIGVTYNEDYKFATDASILLPMSSIPEVFKNAMVGSEYYIYSLNSKNTEEAITQLLLDKEMDTSGLYNVDSANVGRRMIGRIVSVFSYGFILLISLVAIANVFNTISTNVRLRRREFGMLKSMGLSNKGVSKILNIECLIYGTWSVLIGLPLSIPVAYGLYRITSRAFAVTFQIPWYSIVIAVAAVFIVVFVTMLYASVKIKKDNTLDAIRADNI